MTIDGHRSSFQVDPQEFEDIWLVFKKGNIVSLDEFVDTLKEMGYDKRCELVISRVKAYLNRNPKNRDVTKDQFQKFFSVNLDYQEDFQDAFRIIEEFDN
mmetsp:Transcript_12773/g.10917  ORF Transcript_12773/g.10917 Transcript_12773/m.10917 type:complete len:100 (-) Transcript_12773:329-628(-)